MRPRARTRPPSPQSGVQVGKSLRQPAALLNVYKDMKVSPLSTDQFAPILARKLAGKSHDKPRKSSKKDIFEMTQDPRRDARAVPMDSLPVGCGSFSQYMEMEAAFDQIACSAVSQTLNIATETKLKSFFSAEKVTFFFDVPSVGLFYGPTTALVIPHGSGLVGYCHFSRTLLNVSNACAHVQFEKAYDGKRYPLTSQLLIFPIFDTDNTLVAIIEIVRGANDRPFTVEDEHKVKYFQSKFQAYSVYLFECSLRDIDVAELTVVQRLAPFIESMEEKLMRIFNCRKAEIWEYNSDTQDIRQHLSGTKPGITMKANKGGIVGHCLSSNCGVSLIAGEAHAKYSPGVDGNPAHSMIVVPVGNQRSAKIYGVVLRGRKIPNFFTAKDERLLDLIAPIVIASLNSSEMMEKYFCDMEDSMRTRKHQECLLEVVESLSGELHMDELIPTIMTKACKLVDADRCSLFVVSETQDKLITSFHAGLESSIEIGMNAGIAGWTATTGKLANIKNAYEDPRFNRELDRATGYHTNTLLCVPIFDDKGKVHGVTEMINKQTKGGFTSDDEKLIQVFNVFTEISIENARLYQASIDLSLQLRTVIEISQSISETTDSKKLLTQIVKNARRVIGAGRALIYLHDKQNNRWETFASDEDAEAKAIQAKEKGPKGPSFMKKSFIRRMIGVEDVQTDDGDKEESKHRYISRAIHFRESHFDNNTENPYHSIAVVPIVGSDRETIGAFLMQWKKRGTLFTKDDVRLMEAFGVFISIAVERSMMKEAVMYGPRELALRQYLTESERMSVLIPASLIMSNNDITKLMSVTFSAYDCDESELYKTLFWIFDALGLRETYQISNETLLSFLYTLKNCYNDVPYQNWKHAVQISQMLAIVLLAGKGLDIFTPRERFVLLVTALACNVGYKDKSSKDYQTKDVSLRVLFKGDSVEERHRAGILIDVITEPHCNIFSAFEGDELHEMWEVVVDLFQATGMEKHFVIMDEVVETAKNDDKWYKVPGNKMMVMKLIVKMIDISDLARPFELVDKVKSNLGQKFFDSGDLSRCYGLVYTGGEATRESIDVRQSIIGFVNHVAIPLLIHTASIFEMLGLTVEQARQTARLWQKSLTDEPAAPSQQEEESEHTPRES